VATTDGLHKPEGLEDAEAMDLMKRCYEQIIEVAEAYKITVTIEVHGYFTTRPEMMEKMLDFCDSRYLRMNMDTGNTFIAGQDPVAFLKRFVGKVRHVHVKDVSESLAAAVRGEQTGIAVSHCALGDGVNAKNIRRCLEILRDSGFTGVLSMECEGQGGPMIEQSLRWLRDTLTDLNIPIEK
jgi:sugar phosphate isomerase/epimerase